MKDNSPYLYFINQQGKANLVAKVKLNNNNNEDFYPWKIWLVNKKDLMISYTYRRCDEANFKYCLGNGLIDGLELDNYLTIEMDNNNILPELKIVPNPTSGKFWVELPQEMLETETTIQVIDLSGRIIMQQKQQVTNNIIQLDLSNLNDGLYLVRVQDSKGQARTKRILKQGN